MNGSRKPLLGLPSEDDAMAAGWTRTLIPLLNQDEDDSWFHRPRAFRSAHVSKQIASFGEA